MWFAMTRTIRDFSAKIAQPRCAPTIRFVFARRDRPDSGMERQKFVPDDPRTDFFRDATPPAMGLHCKRRHGRREDTGNCKPRPTAEARPFQLLPQLRHPDARFTLQNGVQDLRLFSELQRLLLTDTENPFVPRLMDQQISIATEHYTLRYEQNAAVLQLVSSDGANKLGMARIKALHHIVDELQAEAESGRIKALIITGNSKFFSAGADLNEISELSGPQAFEFSRRGQALMLTIDQFPTPVIAAIRGYCMGGAMDLALACDYRIAAPNAVFGHRGASLGVMTGWGGTQRLPRLIGKARAMQMFLLAEMVKAEEALRIGLVDRIVEDPVTHAVRCFRGVDNQAG
jgi:enoyl-CoA hydratase/carnithine racemase